MRLGKREKHDEAHPHAVLMRRRLKEKIRKIFNKFHSSKHASHLV